MKRGSTVGLAAVICILVIVAVLLSSCDLIRGKATPTPTSLADTWAQIKTSGKITVGTAPPYVPFEYYTKDYTLTGFDIAVMQAVAQNLGLKAEFRDYQFNALAEGLESGDIDAAIAAISITPERQVQFDFSRIYYVNSSTALAKAGSTIPTITQPSQFKGYRVGVQNGSIFQKWVQDNLVDTGIIPSANLQVYGQVDQAVNDLGRDRVDVVLLDQPPAQDYAKQGKGRIVGESVDTERYGIALRKGASTLQSQIDKALQTLFDNGTIKNLAVQYMGLAPDQVIPPPTPVPTVAPTRTATPAKAATATPVPPAPCVEGLKLIQDVSYPDDGMRNAPVMQPGQSFVKVWRVQNTGTCTWDASYTLVYAGGSSAGAAMGGRPVAVQGMVARGANYDIPLPLLAPTTPGTYLAFWQMTDGRGAVFGQKLSVGIVVPAPPTPTPPPTQTPSPQISFTADKTTIDTGQPVVFAWDVQDVKEVYFYAEGQSWQGNGVSGKDARQVFPPQTMSYYLRVVKTDDSVETTAILIAVNQVATAPVIARFDLVPGGQIALGQCVQIIWQVQGDVSRVDVTRNNAAIWDGAPLQGQVQDCPTASGSTAYLLTATGPGGTTNALQYVTVVGPTPTPAPPTPTPVPQPTVTPVPAAPPIIGTSWQLQQLFIPSKGLVPVLQGSGVSAAFNPGGQVSGSSGCNTYTALYQAGIGNSIVIGQPSGTQKACPSAPGTEQEHAFYQDLTQSVEYTINGNQMTMNNSGSQVILVYTR